MKPNHCLKYVLSSVFSLFIIACGGSDNNSSDNSLPDSPIGLTVVEGSQFLDLSWDAVSSASHYHIYLASEDPSTLNDIDDLDTLSDAQHISNIYDTSYTITGLTNDTRYYMVVSAESDSNGEGGISEPVSGMPTAAAANRAPEVTASLNASDDYIFLNTYFFNEYDDVELIATASDDDGTVVSYSWNQTLGPSVALSDATSANPSFFADVDDSYAGISEYNGGYLVQFEFSVTVTDDDSATASANVTFNLILNLPPTVSAGDDQTVDEKSSVSLSASASDTDGTIASYLWTQTSGTPTVALSDFDTATASFTAPDVASDTVFTFRVSVSDDDGDTATDDVSITVVANLAPTVDAGGDQTVEEKSSVSVSLSASANDTDGTIDANSYSWTQISGTPAITLSDSDSANASFTAPDVASDTVFTFRVSVSDNDGDTATDDVSITVIANSAPTVDAGEDQIVDEQTTVPLTATASDVDGTIASYLWTQTSPDTPTAALSYTTIANPIFTAPDVASDTVFNFQVTVSDDDGDTATDDVSITVIANLAPTVDAGADQIVDEQISVTLSASASDVDGTIASYLWTQTSPDTPTVTLSDTTIANPSFTAPDIESETTFTFNVSVRDDDGDTASDVISVTVIPVEVALYVMNDTGITECNDIDGDSTYCFDTTSVYYGQDGSYGRDASVELNDDSDGRVGFSFTKIASDGSEQEAESTDWDCVQDNVTGLMWEIKTVAEDLQDKNWTYSWYNTDESINGGELAEGVSDSGICYASGTGCDTENFVNDVNTMNLCGYSDWRIPTLEELRSLVDYSVTDGSAEVISDETQSAEPTIDTDYFPNNQIGVYWSVTSSYAEIPEYAWVIDFSDGKDNTKHKENSNYVRLVRGGE